VYARSVGLEISEESAFTLLLFETGRKLTDNGNGYSDASDDPDLPDRSVATIPPRATSPDKLFVNDLGQPR